MGIASPSPAAVRWRRFLRRRLAVGSSIFLLALVGIALFAPWVARFDPNRGNLLDTAQGPGAVHWLGTDRQGRDVLARVIFGTRFALGAGVEAVAIALVVGLPLGLLAGFYRGWVDRVVQRVVEVITSLPAVVVAIAVVAATGPGLVKSMIAIGLIYAMSLARLARAQTLAAREEIYVDAARVVGASDRRILLRHVLPNIAPALIVQVTLMFAGAVLAEASLSFLGIGVPPPQPSWGVILTDAANDISVNSWMPFPPGIAIFLTVFAFNQLGDGLRDVFAREARGGNLGVRPVARVLEPSERAPDGGKLSRTDLDPVLRVDDLRVSFPAPDRRDLDVVTGVSFAVAKGETLALVGESGCGKTVTALSIPALVPDPGQARARSIELQGRELVGLTDGEMSSVRGRDIGFVFQEPSASLNPAFTIGWQLRQPLQRHLGLTRTQARARSIDLLGRVGIPNPASRIDSFPHEFSGGMAQRVMVALALSCEPKLVIADEPTTALDVTVQGQVLDLLMGLRDELGLALLLITHDLGVVSDIADRAAVMYAGEIVEVGGVQDVFEHPNHPYTAGLLASVPRNERRTGSRESIAGVVPAAWEWSAGCRFALRCGHAVAGCSVVERPNLLVQVGPEHSARCLRSGELNLAGVEAS